MNNTLKNKIKGVIRRVGKTQKELAEQLNMSERMFSYYISNGFPDDILMDFCKLAKIDYNWLVNENVSSDVISVNEKVQNYNTEIKNVTLQLFLIPVIGRIPAGFPDMKEAKIVDTIRLTEPLTNAFALLVDGDSMFPRIKSGNYVIFQSNVKINHGDIVIALNEFGESFLKKYVEKDNEKWLVSENPSYPNFKMNGEYRIIGKVIERIEREKIR